MSLPLIDLRAKVSVETDAVLEAVQRSTGRDKSEIVRDVLHKWAVQEIHASTLLLQIMRREGITAPDAGTSGNQQ